MKKEYTAPESKITEVRAEGMLCASPDPMNGLFEDWVEDPFDWQ